MSDFVKFWILGALCLGLWKYFRAEVMDHLPTHHRVSAPATLQEPNSLVGWGGVPSQNSNDGTVLLRHPWISNEFQRCIASAERLTGSAVAVEACFQTYKRCIEGRQLPTTNQPDEGCVREVNRKER
jgi:hypothetical protein